MARLLRHEFDCVAVCPRCDGHCEQVYEFEDVVRNERGEFGSARQYACTACRGSYHRDFVPMRGLIEDDLGRFIDKRAWAAFRDARRRGTPAGIPLSATLLPPVRRVVLPPDFGRYSFVAEDR